MSFVVDTDTCSAYIKGHALVYNRFGQYAGRLYISIVTLGELGQPCQGSTKAGAGRGGLAEDRFPARRHSGRGPQIWREPSRAHGRRAGGT